MGNLLGIIPPKTYRLQELSKEQIAKELHPAQRIHVGLSEQFNLARSDDFVRRQRFATRIAVFLGFLSLSSYFWTMYSLKQEKLGPEFDVRIDDAEPDQKSNKTS